MKGSRVKPLGIGQEIGAWLMGDNPRLGPIHRDGFLLAARKALRRRRCASAILARPAVVFGPVDSPPWNTTTALALLDPHATRLDLAVARPKYRPLLSGQRHAIAVQAERTQLAAISAHPAAMVGTGTPKLRA